MKHLTSIAAAACLSLTACIGVDVDIEVLSDDTGRMTGIFEMQRGMYDMAAADGDSDFCDESEGGTLELTPDKAICRMDRTATFEELFAGDDDDTEINAQIEPLGNNTVRVTIPLDDFGNDMDEMLDDPAMLAMFRPMLEGYAISFSVSGAEILSSNGEVSADGRRATFAMPLTGLLDADLDLPDAFVTEVRY